PAKQSVDGHTRLRLGDSCNECQRFGDGALNLRHHLFHDVAHFLRAGSSHDDPEAQWSSMSRRDRNDAEQQYLCQLDDALSGAAQSEHLRYRGSFGSGMIGAPDFIDGDVHRHPIPLSEAEFFFRGSPELRTMQQACQSVSLTQVLLRPSVLRRFAIEANEL